MVLPAVSDSSNLARTTALRSVVQRQPNTSSFLVCCVMLLGGMSTAGIVFSLSRLEEFANSVAVLLAACCPHVLWQSLSLVVFLLIETRVKRQSQYTVVYTSAVSDFESTTAPPDTGHLLAEAKFCA